MSQMINIMRSKYGDKPLTHIMKDPQMLKYALTELQRSQKIKREQELIDNPKTKMCGMLLRVKRMNEEKEAGEKSGE